MHAADFEKIKLLFENTYPVNVKTRNIAAYRAMYTADAVWSPPNAPDACGPEEIESGFTKQIANVDIDPTFTADEIKIFGHIGYVLGSSVAKVTAHDSGETKQVNFRALWIVAKQEAGEWLISRQLWNNKP
jgi:ketosteroid isomerase-like protein